MIPRWDANAIIDLCPTLLERGGGGGWRESPYAAAASPQTWDSKLPLIKDWIDEAGGSGSAGHSLGVGTIDVGRETT